MKIQYEDEYGELIYDAYTDVVPCAGDTIIFANEHFRVKCISWVIEHNYVIIEVTQNIVKSGKKDDNNSGRLTEINNAILAITKRQEAGEKKGRALTEQVVTIRKHINQAIQNSKKD